MAVSAVSFCKERVLAVAILDLSGREFAWLSKAVSPLVECLSKSKVCIYRVI